MAGLEEEMSCLLWPSCSPSAGSLSLGHCWRVFFVSDRR